MAPAILAFLAVVAGFIANIFFVGGTGGTKVAVWLVTVATIVLLAAAIGRAIATRWDGVLIDGRNRVSLSRLQMCAWTLLLLSALITAVSSNLAAGQVAFAVVIRPELLAAMGIAAGSLAATPALLTLKTDAKGASLVAANAAPAEAGWLDIFRSDEEADKNRPDLSKIQQFLITLALVGGYATAVGYQFQALAAGQGFGAFPAIDDKFIWLLGISHAGYLTYKAASKPPNPSS